MIKLLNTVFLCIFVQFTGLMGQVDSTVCFELKQPVEKQDTIALIWIVKSGDSEITKCVSAYDLEYVMQILGGFFFAILGEPCIEPIPAPTYKIKRI